VKTYNQVQGVEQEQSFLGRKSQYESSGNNDGGSDVRKNNGVK
jgi:hypothetical protein